MKIYFYFCKAKSAKIGFFTKMIDPKNRAYILKQNKLNSKIKINEYEQQV